MTDLAVVLGTVGIVGLVAVCVVAVVYGRPFWMRSQGADVEVKVMSEQQPVDRR